MVQQFLLRKVRKEMENKKYVSAITSQSEDFAKWYTDVCIKAELMDYSEVKGFIIYRPYGYALWEQIQKYLDSKFKETGHENVYMPLVIPGSLFNKEKEHVEGFAPEVAKITKIKDEELGDELIIRPTSEVLFCSHYKKIVNSYRDLPKLYNQWCSVVRWEKTTRPFLRGKEFLWQEGHTLHETESEARNETLGMLETYKVLGKDLLAIPFTTGRKTEREKFAGAMETYAIEALMPDGQALQSGTTHFFGQNFTIPFDIKYTSRDNKLEYPYQTSWGVSTRLLGAIIMCHGDDNGLSLPPAVAPIQVVIIPIGKDEKVNAAANEIREELSKNNIRVKLDNSERTPGFKFSEYEMKGIPLRIEIGPRDLEGGNVTLAKRYNHEKVLISAKNITKTIIEVLFAIQSEMYNKVQTYTKQKTNIAYTYDEFKNYIKIGGYVKMSVSNDVEEQVKAETGATARVILDEPLLYKKCPISGKATTMTVLFARAY